MLNTVRFAGGRTKFNQVSMYRKQIVADCSTSVFADLNWKLSSSSWTCQKCKLIWTRTIIVHHPRRYPSPFVSFDDARPSSFFSTAVFLATNKSSITSRYLDKSPTSILDNNHVKNSKIISDNKWNKGLNGCAHPSSYGRGMMGIDTLKSFFLQRLQTFFSLVAFSDVVQIYKYHLVILKHSIERRANPLILR